MQALALIILATLAQHICYGTLSSDGSDIDVTPATAGQVALPSDLSCYYVC